MNSVPTGFIVIIKLNNCIPDIIVDRVIIAADVFRKMGFEVSFLPNPTVEKLLFEIRSNIQIYPESCCHYVGFFFIGYGMVNPNSHQPYLELHDGVISVQYCMDFTIQQNIHRHPLKLMFFFDCCFFFFDCCFFCYQLYFNKPFAFNFPPRSIVVFATSPGIRCTDRDKATEYLIRWSNELCEQLENVQKGQTLTSVLELANEKVIKTSYDFKHHPPQFSSSAGPLVLKGSPSANYICYYYFITYSYYSHTCVH